MRQLESCTRAADLFGLYVKAVFADTCSGDGAMPSRSMAYLTAKQLDCPILVESQCRWSRKLPGTDPLVDVEVLVVGDGKRVSVDRIFGNHLSVVVPSQRYLP